MIARPQYTEFLALMDADHACDIFGAVTCTQEQTTSVYGSAERKADKWPLGVIGVHSNALGDRSFSALGINSGIDLAFFSGFQTVRTGHHRGAASGRTDPLYYQVVFALISEFETELQCLPSFDSAKIMLFGIKYNRRLRERDRRQKNQGGQTYQLPHASILQHSTANYAGKSFVAAHQSGHIRGTRKAISRVLY